MWQERVGRLSRGKSAGSSDGGNAAPAEEGTAQTSTSDDYSAAGMGGGAASEMIVRRKDGDLLLPSGSGQQQANGQPLKLVKHFPGGQVPDHLANVPPAKLAAPQPPAAPPTAPAPVEESPVSGEAGGGKSDAENRPVKQGSTEVRPDLLTKTRQPEEEAAGPGQSVEVDNIVDPLTKRMSEERRGEEVVEAPPSGQDEVGHQVPPSTIPPSQQETGSAVYSHAPSVADPVYHAPAPPAAREVPVQHAPAMLAGSQPIVAGAGVPEQQIPPTTGVFKIPPRAPASKGTAGATPPPLPTQQESPQEHSKGGHQSSSQGVPPPVEPPPLERQSSSQGVPPPVEPPRGAVERNYAPVPPPAYAAPGVASTAATSQTQLPPADALARDKPSEDGPQYFSIGSPGESNSAASSSPADSQSLEQPLEQSASPALPPVTNAGGYPRHEEPTPAPTTSYSVPTHSGGPGPTPAHVEQRGESPPLVAPSLASVTQTTTPVVSGFTAIAPGKIIEADASVEDLT